MFNINSLKVGKRIEIRDPITKTRIKGSIKRFDNKIIVIETNGITLYFQLKRLERCDVKIH